MVNDHVIRRAAEMLLRAAPGSKVILFGSYAHAVVHPDSDLDFLVVEPHVDDARAEMVRLR